MEEKPLSIVAYQPIIQTSSEQAGAREPDGVYVDDANLVSWWELEEATGATRTDSIGSNDLADNNTVVQSADAQQGTYSADFESTNNEYLDIADNASLSITGSLTILLRIKVESFPADMFLAGKYVTSGNQRSYMVWVDDLGTTGKIYFNVSSNGTAVTNVSQTGTISAGSWISVAAVYDGTDLRIYTDGSLDCTPQAYTSGINDGTAAFRLGRHGDNIWSYDGLMDDVAILNRALSAAEISDWHTNGIRAIPDPVTVYSAQYPAYSETLQTEKETYTITDGVGFDRASFTLMGNDEYLYDWFENGLVRDVVWMAPDSGICWHGYVSKLTLTIGDRKRVKSVEDMANRIIFNYTALDTSSNPPVAGAKATITVDDTRSQARYGIKAAIVSGSECTAATADDRARAHLNWSKYIVTDETVNVGRGKPSELKVELSGYAYMLNWNIYTQTTTSGTANANVVVAAILAADENSALDESTVNIDVNATATEQYWDGEEPAWKIIQELAQRGLESGSIGYRWHCGVYERRRVTFKAAEGVDDNEIPYSTNKHNILHRQARDAADIFIDEAGREWMPWELRPDRLLYEDGVLGRPMYIYQVKVTAPWRVVLQGSDRTNPLAGVLTSDCQ